MADPMPLDDAAIAAVDLVGRSGATDFTWGYLHDDVPTEEAGWYAHAQYRGARITVEDQPGPVEAMEALARKVLTGGKCTGCGRLVALSDHGAVAYDGLMADGSTWSVEEARAAGQCRWRRVGKRWEMGCERRSAKTPSAFPRTQPRRRPRKQRRKP